MSQETKTYQNPLAQMSRLEALSLPHVKWIAWLRQRDQLRDDCYRAELPAREAVRAELEG